MKSFQFLFNFVIDYIYMYFLYFYSILYFSTSSLNEVFSWCNSCLWLICIIQLYLLLIPLFLFILNCICTAHILCFLFISFFPSLSIISCSHAFLFSIIINSSLIMPLHTLQPALSLPPIHSLLLYYSSHYFPLVSRLSSSSLTLLSLAWLLSTVEKRCCRQH